MAKIIQAFNGIFRWLSNFSSVNVVLDGITYPSVENAYQAAKTLNLQQRAWFLACSPLKAKQLGKAVELREDWLDVRLDVMADLCQQKYEQEPYRRMLLNTGDAEIQEGNYWNDTFWGICRGQGHNHLGLIIMQIRAKLREEEVRAKEETL